jgi:16S rRNA (cytidine1402-2'-O)-methyltransferase
VKFFAEHAEASYSLVCYESTHRIEKFLRDAEACLGPDRVVCVAREMTKAFETFRVGSLVSVLPQLKGKQLKGEFVVVIAPATYQL